MSLTTGECVEYVMFYKKNLFDVRIEVDMAGNIYADATHTSFSLRYALFKGSWEESHVWLDAIKGGIRVEPNVVLDILEEILKEGKVLNEKSC